MGETKFIYLYYHRIVEVVRGTVGGRHHVGGRGQRSYWPGRERPFPHHVEMVGGSQMSISHHLLSEFLNIFSVADSVAWLVRIVCHVDV